MTETKSAGSAVEGTSRVIRIAFSMPIPTANQWYSLAYEVEPLVPIVFHAKKYSHANPPTI